MKKALQREEMAFLYMKDGKVLPEEMCVEEIIAAINRGIAGEWGDDSYQTIVLRKLHKWICRYIGEELTEDFFNELNRDLIHVPYSNQIVPPGFYSPERSEPESIYLAILDRPLSAEAMAAKEFSRLITYGMLNRIKRCQLSGCENIFVGPPQAKWCSKTCGSKYRVTKKRKRES